MLANIKTDENVSIITLDDGKANVFSPTMISEFNLLLDQVPTNKGSLLIHGRPGMFSAGFDLKVISSGDIPKIKKMSLSRF